MQRDILQPFRCSLLGDVITLKVVHLFLVGICHNKLYTGNILGHFIYRISLRATLDDCSSVLKEKWLAIKSELLRGDPSADSISCFQYCYCVSVLDKKLSSCKPTNA